MTVGGVTESHACKANMETPLRDKACGVQKGFLTQCTDVRLTGKKAGCPAPWARHWVEVFDPNWSNSFSGWVARDYLDCPEDGQRLRKKSDAQLH
jgi:hypothetical protein